MAQDGAFVVNTPYDDVFRTLLIDCSELIIPLINETFGENYTGKEKVDFSQNEHFLGKQDGVSDKRISDSSFTIIGAKRQKFLYECQSTADSSMLVRIFEYATQIAVEQGEIEEHTLKVQIPRCAVLFLRSTKNTPDKMNIELDTPGGNVTFDIPITKAQRYSLDEIFEKNLLFLIPFYIFSYERRFPEYNSNEGKLEELKREYAKIMEYLNGLQRESRISAYTKRTIVEMSGKVLENIAQKYDALREGVKSVMGGKVLDYEAKRIWNEGIKEAVIKMYKSGMSVVQIAAIMEYSVEDVENWIKSTEEETLV